MQVDVSNYSIAIHGFFALFGAVVHAAKAYQRGTSKTWVDFLTLTIMSSFSGTMFALLALYSFPDQPYLTWAIAGTGGFLGVEGMTLIIERVRTLISK